MRSGERYWCRVGMVLRQAVLFLAFMNSIVAMGVPQMLYRAQFDTSTTAFATSPCVANLPSFSSAPSGTYGPSATANMSLALTSSVLYTGSLPYFSLDGSECSYCLWFRATSSSRNLMNRYVKSSNKPIFYLDLLFDKSLQASFLWGNGAHSNIYLATSANAVSLTVWNHVCVSAASGIFSIFINGTSVASTTFSSPVVMTMSLSGYFSVGDSGVSVDELMFFTGSIDGMFADSVKRLGGATIPLTAYLSPLHNGSVNVPVMLSPTSSAPPASSLSSYLSSKWSVSGDCGSLQTSNLSNAALNVTMKKPGLTVVSYSINSPISCASASATINAFGTPPSLQSSFVPLLSVSDGTSFSAAVSVQGYPIPIVNWFKFGDPRPSIVGGESHGACPAQHRHIGERISPVHVQSGVVLAIDNFVQSDEGIYYAVASNRYGATFSSNLTLHWARASSDSNAVDSSSSPIGGVVAGSVVASLLCAGFVFFVVLCICCCALVCCVVCGVLFVALFTFLVLGLVVSSSTMLSGIGGSLAVYKIVSGGKEIGPGYRELNIHEIEFLSEIGRGTYGTVWKCRWHNVDVAIKVLHGHYDEEGLELLREQFGLLEALGNHPNVITVSGGVTLGDRVCYMMEYCRRGSLHRYLHSHPTLPTAMQLRLIHNVASGLHHLHLCGVLHGCLTARNVMISDNFSALLCDYGGVRSLPTVAGIRRSQTTESFGLPGTDDDDDSGTICDGADDNDQPEAVRSRSVSTETDESAYITGGSFGGRLRALSRATSSRRPVLRPKISGAVRWMAPEQFTGSAASAVTDVYALGMVMWEVVTSAAEAPLSKLSIEQFVREVVVRRTRPIIPESCDSTLRQLINICWEHNPTQRISLDGLLRVLGKHPLINLSTSIQVPSSNSNSLTHTLSESDSCCATDHSSEPVVAVLSEYVTPDAVLGESDSGSDVPTAASSDALPVLSEYDVPSLAALAGGHLIGDVQQIGDNVAGVAGSNLCDIEDDIPCVEGIKSEAALTKEKKDKEKKEKKEKKKKKEMKEMKHVPMDQE